MGKCSHSEWEEWMDYCTQCGEDSLRVIVAEKRIAELEAVAEAAFDHCNTSYGTEEFYRTRAELQNALRAGYLGGGG